jgi:MarR-like DNA-binding transcriptional regulator SgrR of sgrS sRNA
LENHEKYKNPSDLLLDKNLSKEDKIVMLKQWLEDEEDLSRASDEGMIGKTQSDNLKQVKKALITLEQSLN